MNPDDFENSVSQHYKSLGFVIQQTPKSKDYGVDIIAEKGDDRIAIQVKMYDARVVNYKEVMYLFAGSEHYNCNKSILLSSGIVSDEAKSEAQKLNVEIIENWHPKIPDLKQNGSINENQKSANKEEYELNFSDIWEKYIVPLRGQTVLTVTGKENYISDVNWSYLERISSNNKTSKIKIEIFKNCFHILIEKSKITRDEINHLYPGRASAIIFAVLSKILFFRLVEKPKATLVFIRNAT